MDLFSSIVAPERRHPQFVELHASLVHEKARTLMNALLNRMGDPNGGFVRHFQSDGFHSRVFEIACFAYLEEVGLSIDRSRERPDFLASGHGCRVAVEAVTANPPTGQATDISLRQMAPLSDDQVFDKANREFPGRIGKSLHKKLGHGYHNLDHCRNRPLVFMVAPFFEAGSGFYTDDALVYPLFGAPEGPPNAIFPFFQREEAAAVSAVLYCNQFTVSRFFRLANDFNAHDAPATIRRGTCYRRHGDDELALSRFSHSLGSPGVPKESWSEGVTIFENPRARNPLPRGVLPGTCYLSVQDGFVTREVSDFHPVVSFTQIHIERPEQP